MPQFQSNSGTPVRLSIACLLAWSLSSPVQALDLEFFDGELFVNVNHTLTYGVNYSVEEPNSQIIYGGEYNQDVVSGGDQACTPAEQQDNGYTATACGNGGRNTAPNDDYSHLAFEEGIFANQFKGTTDITATWGEFTAFTRILYFYDYEIMNQSRGNHPSTHYEESYGNPNPNIGATTKQDYGFQDEIQFHENAEREIGKDIRALDAYVAWDTFIGDSALTMRVGNQVINWGQSTFLPGIGITNPIDLNRLFSPGFELRELFKPVPLAFVSYGLTENIAMEAYYQFEWEPVALPPGGSFFAVNNYVGEGINHSGQAVTCLDGSPNNLGFADDAFDNNTGARGPDGLDDIGGGLGGFCVIPSTPAFADDGDEFGFRLQVTLPWLNYTQFSLYAIRYHSRLPHVGAITAGLVPNAGDLLCAAVNNSVDDPLGLGALDAPCTAASSRVDEFPAVQVKYGQDLWAYGFSFSGNIPGGWTLQGEVSLKKDMPLQVSLPELISVAGWLSIDVPGVGGTVDCSLRQLDQTGYCREVQLGDGSGTPADLSPPGNLNLPAGLTCDPSKEICDPYCASGGNTGAQQGGSPAAATYSGNCAYNLGALVASDGAAQGIVPLDFLQAQVTFLKLFPQALGGDTLLFVAEIIGTKVMDMPGVSEIMFEKTDFSDANNRKRSHAEDFGWAYRFLVRNEYSNLFGTSWSVTPTFVWFHDVNGSPPANSGTFLEDRKQAILLFPFSYQNKYTITFKYAWFGGAPQSNIFQDRDSVGITFSATM